MAFYCYIVPGGRNGTIYIGSTDSLTTRIWQHKNKAFEGFTADYDCDQLVWFRVFDTRDGAFRCERRMKEWRRSWKVRLIEDDNFYWRDLYWEACGLAKPGEPLRIVGLVETASEASPPDGGGLAGSRPSPG